MADRNPPEEIEFSVPDEIELFRAIAAGRGRKRIDHARSIKKYLDSYYDYLIKGRGKIVPCLPKESPNE